MNKELSVTEGEMTCLSEEAYQTTLDAGMTRLSDEVSQTMLATSLEAAAMQPVDAADKGQQEQYKIGDYISDRYEVIAIHKGALGVVYAVYDHEKELPRALKTLQQQYAINKSVLDLFYEEAALWVKLEKHPYIVRAYEVEFVEKQPYVVMEYITGRNGNDLRSWLGSSWLTLPVAVEMGLKIAQGMQYVQQKVPGLIHRDLKPANILVDEYAQPYITDFGLAFAAGADAGTPAYMAPEQWNKGTLTVQTDIYAYGCILYEMLTGHRMYAAASPAEWRKRHLTEQSAAPSALKSEIPPELEQFVLRCLEKDKEHRPKNWDEVVEVMAGWVYHLTGQPPVMDFSSYNLSARELLTASCSLFYLKKYSEALAITDRVIDLEPDLINIWYVKAALSIQFELNDELADCYNHILELEPDIYSHEYYLMKGDCIILKWLKRYEEALTCLDIVLEETPWDDELWDCKGFILIELKRYNEALECLDQALMINPGSHKSMWYKCRALTEIGRYIEALEYCNRYMELIPNDSAAWIGKGTIFLRTGHYDESLDCFDRALVLEPVLYEAYINKTILFINQGRYQEAIECCDKAIECEPNKDKPYIQKAFCFQKLSQFEKALKCLNELLEFKADDYLIFSQKAQILYVTKRYQEAVQCCDMAIELNPISDDAWSCKRLSMEKLYGADCLGLFDQALEVYPSNKVALKEKGIILFRLSHYEEAISCFDQALKIDANLYDALKFKGYSLYSKDNKKEALHCFCQASELDASDCDVFYYKGILLDAFNNNEAALESFNHILELKSENADYHSAKGRTLYHMGRYEESVESCSKALRIQPEDTWGLEYKGKSLKKLNLHEEGDIYLKQLLELEPDLDIWDDY